jgi:SEC-C motif-containing protein
MRCPCDLDQNYEQCCGRYIDQHQYAPTPSALMRSRYSAFVLGRMDYIAATMRKDALKNFDAHETATWLKDVSWQKVVLFKEQLKTPRRGFVLFEAYYLFKEKPKMMRERSEFQKIGDRWFYVDGKLVDPQPK